MASKYLQKFPIPAGFQQILSDFTREVLRDQPSNIIQYAAQYFEMLEKGKKLDFDSKYNVKKDDKKYELNYNDKKAEDIVKKASSITQKVNKNVTVAPVHQTSVHVSQKSQQHVQQRSQQPFHQSSQHHQQHVQKHHQQQHVHQHSQEPSHHVIGTEKTVTGQQTTNYVNDLANKFAEEQGQQNLIQLAVEQTVNKFFERYDIDSNGYLSSTELSRFVNQVAGQMYEGTQISGEQIQQFVNEVDKDRDGKISKDQLFRFIKRLLLNL